MCGWYTDITIDIILQRIAIQINVLFVVGCGLLEPNQYFQMTKVTG